MDRLTIQDCMITARSKREVYNLLCVMGNVLLPPIEQCNHAFIKDLIQGKKNV